MAERTPATPFTAEPSINSANCGAARSVASAAARFSTRARVVARSRAGTGPSSVPAARGIGRALITGTRLNEREHETRADSPFEPTNTSTTHHDAPSVNRRLASRPEKTSTMVRS